MKEYNIKILEELKENYRNSKKVTKKVTEITGVHMIPIGVDEGKLIEAKGILDIVNSINKFTNELATKKAIIMKEVNNELIEYFSRFINKEFNIIDSENKEIVNENINVVAIEDVKGLEFDSTIVFLNGMNENEKYVALTRALSNCYVIY